MDQKSAAGNGSLGLVVVGLGRVGSSLLAGIEAARAHLVHPWGSLVEAGGWGRGPENTGSPLRATASLAELGDLVLGAFELREDDAYRAALRAGLVSRAVLDELRGKLCPVRAMAGARQAPTRRHLADAIAEDLRGFLAHNHCARGVVVCTIPGARTAAPKKAFTSAELLAALEEGAEWVTPSLVYATAAAQAGFSFVAASEDGALTAPGLSALFEEARLPIAGAGLLGPDAALREALAQVLGDEGLGLVGATSLSTRAQERGTQLWGGPDRTQEMALASAWAGGSLELSVELRGPVALYLAARALDAALLLDFATRAGRRGAQEYLDALFVQRLSGAAPRAAHGQTIAARRKRLLAELPSLTEAALRNSRAA